MVTPVVSQLIEAVSQLSDEQATVLLELVHMLHPNGEEERQPEPYDPAKDGTIGFIDGPTDASTRYKDIIRENVKRRGAWTQKDPE
jgi:hypothetical protein